MKDIIILLTSGEFWAGITAFCVVVIPLFTKKVIKRKRKKKLVKK